MSAYDDMVDSGADVGVGVVAGLSFRLLGRWRRDEGSATVFEKLDIKIPQRCGCRRLDKINVL